MLNALYNQVDEEVHKLVILSNKSQKQLEGLLEVRKFEEQTQQVSFYYFTLDIVVCCFPPLSAKLYTQSVNNQLSFQIKLWFSGEGEKQLAPLELLTLSATKIKEMRESLDQFLDESVVNSATIFQHILHLLCLMFRRQEVLN